MTLSYLFDKELDLQKLIWRGMTELNDDVIYIRKFAKSAVLAADTEKAIWGYSSDKTFLSSAETMSVVSASANDTSAGTGARYVLLSGVDDNYDIKSETVIMNGTTPVVTTQTFLRLYNARVVGAGSGKVNAGAITITASTAGTVQEYIPAAEGLGHSSYMVCPAGYNAIALDTIYSIYRSSGGTGVRRGEFHVYAELPIPSLGTVRYATQELGMSSDGGATVLRPNLPGPIPEKMDLWYTCTAEQSNTYATVQFTWLLIKHEFMDRLSIP